MRDAAFEAALNQRAWVCRARVRLAGDLAAMTPGYELNGELEAARVQPVEGAAKDSLVGQIPTATHVAYVRYQDLRVGDCLAVVDGELRLAADATQGSEGLSLQSADGLVVGAIVQLHSGTTIDEGVITGVNENDVTITPGLQHTHTAGEAVWMVNVYLVDGVFDVAGVRHHLKLMMREKR
jgi:hypothetical protein